MAMNNVHVKIIMYTNYSHNTNSIYIMIILTSMYKSPYVSIFPDQFPMGCNQRRPVQTDTADVFNCTITRRHKLARPMQ